jgi:endogenous inhibitor of DNA gyrase (YacG/DUF329 family)
MLTHTQPMTSSGNPAKPCVICGKPQTDRNRPFCSQRCADVDLHKWLSQSYAIPGSAEEFPELPPETDTER